MNIICELLWTRLDNVWVNCSGHFMGELSWTFWVNFSGHYLRLTKWTSWSSWFSSLKTWKSRFSMKWIYKSWFLRNFEFINNHNTMADVCYETPQKKASKHCIFIVYKLILLPHYLNDSKWSQMTPNDHLCVWWGQLKSFGIIWNHLRSFRVI